MGHLRYYSFVIMLLVLLFYSVPGLGIGGDSSQAVVTSTIDGVNGLTHLIISGSQDKQNVLFIHGVLFGSMTWDRTMEAFPDSQFRTIRYDLIGTGQSSKPDILYNAPPFLTQLEEVWNYAEVDSPVVIIAASLGAIIAARKACGTPEAISGLVLIAPAGFQSEYHWSSRLVRFPVLARPLFFLLSRSKRLLHYLCSDLLATEQQEKFIPALQRCYQKWGDRKTLISTLRDFPLYDVEGLYEELSETQIPVLILWGSEDRIVRYPGMQAVRELLPNAQIEVIEGGHHVLQCNRPAAVNEKLREFIANLD